MTGHLGAAFRVAAGAKKGWRFASATRRRRCDKALRSPGLEKFIGFRAGRELGARIQTSLATFSAPRSRSTRGERTASRYLASPAIKTARHHQRRPLDCDPLRVRPCSCFVATVAVNVAAAAAAAAERQGNHLTDINKQRRIFHLQRGQRPSGRRRRRGGKTPADECRLSLLCRHAASARASAAAAATYCQ